MAVYLKKFENHMQYETYINGSGAILPNVSTCTTEGDVHYNPYVEPVETRVVAKFNITDTTNPTSIGYNQYTSGFSAIEIDGIEQLSVVSAYTFSTTGEHIVKYTLTDPTSIGYRAFYNCSGLTSIDMPDSVTSIGNQAFQNCKSLTSIDIPDRVISIGDSAFQYCGGLTSATIGSGVTSIGTFAFESCTSLTSCTIGDSVTDIGIYAFNSCRSLTSIDIPSGVASIGNNAFCFCSGLTSIVCNATTAPTITRSTFKGVKTGGTLYVPSGSTGYDVWMDTGDYYLGSYGWTKVEQ